MRWKVFFAAATGKHHRDANAACQDSGHHIAEGDVLIGVVCDGAGSADHGQFGADFVARTLAQLLALAVREGRYAPETAAGRGDFVRAAVQQARAQLAASAASAGHELRHCACTLVGCIATRAGGCFFHIGDGFAICVRDTGDTVLSQPENGEFADQTYFVTDTNWEEHLRITPIPAVQPGSLIGLMSDGASPFAVNRARTGFYGPFIDPIVGYLRTASEPGGSQALLKVLEDEKTYAITADDKTLLLALAS